MSRTVRIPITGPVLEWARKESGLSRAELAFKLNVAPIDVESWETETTQPTKTQFKKLTATLRRPSAIFFLDTPPPAGAFKASFRRASEATGLINPDELKPLRDARRYQAVAEWILAELDESQQSPLPVVFDPRSASPQLVADKVRTTLAVSFNEQLAFPDAAKSLKAWRAAAEERLGMFVFQMQFPNEAKYTRGFCLPSDTAPIVVLNSAFTEPARIFTLFHECAHLILRDAILCDVWSTRNTKSEHERWAESFAANVLLPQVPFRQLLRQIVRNEELNTEHVRIAARRTKCSVRAVALRCIEIGAANWDLYEQVVKETKDVDFKPPAKPGGGERAAQRKLREIGPRLPVALFRARDEDIIGHYDVLRHLDMSNEQTKELESSIASGVV
ncbi:XRE family transcriptional regulator [Catellatospora paridis]|uniref:XRE family transcriptional regulator n=1 Tax=Catellatospora paridis TaxID=1617086 RepID=UPI0012D46546|nr:XRE family transcriptional regulator [Catellatospora paridis]